MSTKIAERRRKNSERLASGSTKTNIRQKTQYVASMDWRLAQVTQGIQEQIFVSRLNGTRNIRRHGSDRSTPDAGQICNPADGVPGGFVAGVDGYGEPWNIVRIGAVGLAHDVPEFCGRSPPLFAAWRFWLPPGSFMVGSNCPRTIHGSAQAASALAPYSYLSSPHGRMLATFLSGIAEFERYLICERIKSGLAAARARGRKLGSQAGVRPKSDKLDPKVMDAIEACRSYRWIARDLGISKNTVTEIVRRHRETA